MIYQLLKFHNKKNHFFSTTVTMLDIPDYVRNKLLLPNILLIYVVQAFKMSWCVVCEWNLSYSCLTGYAAQNSVMPVGNEMGAPTKHPIQCLLAALRQ